MRGNFLDIPFLVHGVPAVPSFRRTKFTNSNMPKLTHKQRTHFTARSTGIAELGDGTVKWAFCLYKTYGKETIYKHKILV
jgi:hypothetical protein